MTYSLLQGFFERCFELLVRSLAGNLGSASFRGYNAKVAYVPKTQSPDGATVDYLHEWVSLPLHDPGFRRVFTYHEDSIPHLTNWLFMNERLQKVNMMGDVPGMSSASWRNTISFKHHDPEPVSHEDFTTGKVHLGITFNDSTQWKYRFPAKTFRTVTMGGITNLHLGGADVYVNTEQTVRHHEELLESVNSQVVFHYRSRRPVVRDDLKNTQGARNSLYEISAQSKAWKSTGLSKDDLQNYIKEIGDAKTQAARDKGDSVIGNIPLSVFKKIPTGIWDNTKSLKNISLDEISKTWDDRDDLRDTQKPRSQVWYRYEGVVRWEAVQTDPTKVFNKNSYQELESSRYKEGNNAFSGKKLNSPTETQDFKNPALTKNSPQVLLEIRPQDIQPGGKKTYDGLDFDKIKSTAGDDQAKLIMASPQFIFVGAENPGTIESNSEATAYKWSGNSSKNELMIGPVLPANELTHDTATIPENIFAVSAKKDIKNCWLNALPEKPPGSENKAMKSHFGILGGEKLVNGKSGLELFGREALLLGSGIKPQNIKWTSSILLQPTGIILETKGKEEKDDNYTMISMLNHILSLQKKVDTLESLITMNEKGITLSVNTTKITIAEDKISFEVKGEDVGEFSKEGWLSKSAKRLGLSSLQIRT